MELLPPFQLLRPDSVDTAVALMSEAGNGRYLAGGTDLLVNARRGIEMPETLVGLDAIPELNEITKQNRGVRIGAAVTLEALAGDAGTERAFPAVAQAAAAVAGPTHRAYGTVGGNLCLDTRCLFYNQSEW